MMTGWFGMFRFIHFISYPITSVPSPGKCSPITRNRMRNTTAAYSLFLTALDKLPLFLLCLPHLRIVETFFPDDLRVIWGLLGSTPRNRTDNTFGNRFRNSVNHLSLLSTVEFPSVQGLGVIRSRSIVLLPLQTVPNHCTSSTKRLLLQLLVSS